MNTPKIIEQQEKNQEAFDYFLSFRMDELKSDDQYYLNAMMDYIESLEAMIKTWETSFISKPNN